MLTIKLFDKRTGVMSSMKHGERSKRELRAGIVAAVQLHQRNPTMILVVDSSSRGQLIYSESIAVTKHYFPDVPDVRLPVSVSKSKERSKAKCQTKKRSSGRCSMREIEVKMRGKWFPLNPGDVSTEDVRGYLIVRFAADRSILEFRPVEWRILES